MRVWLLCLGLIAGVAALPASAAPRVNNGGGAWACRVGGELRWLRAADFFEPIPERRAPRDFGPATTAEIFASQGRLVAERIPELHKLLQRWPVDFSKTVRYVDFPLSNTDDMNFTTRPAPADCEGGAVSYEQVAVYLYDDTLLISRALWENPRLAPADQAAILFHEWIYRALRGDRDEQTSSRTRRIVAWLFAEVPAEAAIKGISRELLYSAADQVEDELATFPVSPRCEAFLDGTVVGSWQARQGRYGEHGGFRAGGLRFEIETSEKDGIPKLLRATDERSGWGFTLDSAVARASYLRLKLAELRFRTGGKRGVEGLLRCWNQF